MSATGAGSRVPGRCGWSIPPTPTSIVVSPFDDGRFVVALWNADRVVTVPISGDGEVTDLLEGVSRPQHLWWTATRC